jgi:CHAT domain-containing protein
MSGRGQGEGPARSKHPSTVGEAHEQLKPAYLAFVMRAGDPGEPAIVPLGAAAAIDDAIARWRKQITAVAFAGGRSTDRAEIALRRSGTQLRARIWDPLAPHLAGARRIFIVPDGPLHLVNWDALPAAASGAAYLIEQAPLFHYVSAERDLVLDASRDAPTGAQTDAPNGGPPAPRHGLLIVDNPVFDRTSGFDPLPASAREAETIAGIWRTAHRADGSMDVSRLSGRAATEAEFKRRAANARVLHLATHGFFLSGLRPSTDDENPLLRAGFALTGAHRHRSQTAGVEGPDAGAGEGAGGEDGMLTAEEIASLDLSAVEWAVLSACDTGVGEVRAGEGVFGLRRAFHVAGARTVIMSLWAVDDEDALRWMTSVYDRRFRRGAETLEAVRASSLEQLRRRRKTGLSTHPFYWAAFIAAGDWR